MDIFISWSGNEISRAIAIHLKSLMEKTLNGAKNNIFISSKHLKKGKKWMEELDKALANAFICLAVVTEQNQTAPWMNYEVGAIYFNKHKKNEKIICPLLYEFDDLSGNHPFKSFQCAKIKKDKIQQVLKDIAQQLKYDFNEPIFEEEYPKFEENIKYEKLNPEGIKDFCINKQCVIFPTQKKGYKPKTLYIGFPMASCPEKYATNRNSVLNIINILNYKFRDIHCAAKEIKSSNEFEGEETSFRDNMFKLKQSEYCLFIYTNKTPSSILVEIGYSMAIGKKIIIFAKRDILPFMLKKIDKQIPQKVKIYKYESMAKLETMISKEKDSIFDFENQ